MLFSIDKSDVETFTVITNPHRTYSSSSNGVIGSVNVFPRHSLIEKETAPLSSFISLTHDDTDINSYLKSLKALGRFARLPVYPLNTGVKVLFQKAINTFLDKVNKQQSSVRKQHILDIVRFTPTVTFTSNTLRKLAIKDQLSKYYRVDYPSAHWAYTNYNSLNFFTASCVPTSSVLLYPNIESNILQEGYVSGTYTPSGSFSFDFYINPRYQQDQPNVEFKAGTILHLSSTFALSLISGSAKDEYGKALCFRLKLQLSHSADIKPSLATPGIYPNDLVFLSDDNSLNYNSWHHCIVRWSGPNNNGFGSFNIDGIDKGIFTVPSATIAPKLVNATKSNPDVLCVGNYYEGTNNGINSQAYFFANDPSLRDGLQQLIDDVGGIDAPTYYKFEHPLNAEIHDLAIRRIYMSNNDIIFSSSIGPKSLDSTFAFYLPPFFVEESPFRQSVNGYGGIPQTPFYEVDGTTSEPFNTAMSFGVNGHYINLENFTRDFASNVFPRLHHLSQSTINTTTTAQEANEFLYKQPFVVKRNLSIVPCDDGNFVPSYELLASESMIRTIDDLGVEELSFISLDNMIQTSSLLMNSNYDSSETFINEAIGFTPEQPGLSPGKAFLNYVKQTNIAISSGTYDAIMTGAAPLTIYQRTLDSSSNAVTFFNISNLFYGKRMSPGSLVITDTSLSGSSGKIKVTLKDNGIGTIYRSDSFTNASTWNAVGTVFYDEGIIAIKSPHLMFFGKDGFNISFNGEQNIHIMAIDANAQSHMLNSSSNPNYQKYNSSDLMSNNNQDFVYITGINYHDENLNVVMKTTLAQPIMKCFGKKINFRTKIDF